jgi:sulfite exporter TauE/SafE
VQGGLLASSLAQQIEHELGVPAPAPLMGARKPAHGKKGKHKGNRAKATAHRAQESGMKAREHSVSQPVTMKRPNTAMPIALFLLAKLVVYTLLGALLGLVGSFLTFNPITRAVLMLAIGVFMVGNGLRLLNVHPIFRYFNLEPPKFITRYIRRTAKKSTEEGAEKNYATPLFLGALTVFIPCGVTQAMMAAALGTGSVAQSAAMMFAFTLGTSPVFFLVAYLTTQVGARMEKFFMRFVAVTVLVLGLVTLNSGLTLMGSPLAFGNLTRGLAAAEPTPQATSAAAFNMDGIIQLAVENNGYYPQVLHAKPDTALKLALVTDNTRSCARDFVIPALRYYQLLPLSGTTLVDIPPQAAGSVLNFTCSMGMYSGQIVFDQ